MAAKRIIQAITLPVAMAFLLLLFMTMFPTVWIIASCDWWFNNKSLAEVFRDLK